MIVLPADVKIIGGVGSMEIGRGKRDRPDFHRAFNPSSGNRRSGIQ
jgi:hypothetical protein